MDLPPLYFMALKKECYYLVFDCTYSYDKQTFG